MLKTLFFLKSLDRAALRGPSDRSHAFGVALVMGSSLACLIFKTPDFDLRIPETT